MVIAEIFLPQSNQRCTPRMEAEILQPRPKDGNINVKW